MLDKNDKFSQRCREIVSDLVTESINQQITEAHSAYEGDGRTIHTPFGTVLIWNAAEQDVLVMIGRLKKQNLTYPQIAAELKLAGYRDRTGIPYTVNQIKSYVSRATHSEDTLNRIAQSD